jgi:3-isopropylmalate dehydrogenase
VINKTTYSIAVFPGDGIGEEIMSACLSVLENLERTVGGYSLKYEILPAGAQYYSESGRDISDESLEKARNADAILLGAMGLPHIRYPDGTEISPHLKMRALFDLYAGVRPVKSFPNVPGPLADARANNIDLIVLRESTEGLFASAGKGEVIDNREARETLVITRRTCERLFDQAFSIAKRRKKNGGKGRVTCVDKANVFKAYAFFRKIFTERAARHPEIDVEYYYVDAMALDLVRRPWDFDVLVSENMFADILSDIGGGIIGGMGIAPCAEIGDQHGLFQPAHGSAPDLADSGKANPTAMFLSAAMMLDWLGNKHDNRRCGMAATLLENVVTAGFSSGTVHPIEFGGPHGVLEVEKAVIELIRIEKDRI